MQSHSQTLTTFKKAGASKLVLGFLVAATTAIIGMAGIAGAHPTLPDHVPDHAKANAEGKASASANANSRLHRGGGYGGGDVNVGVNIEGNNNTVTIIIRYLFGG
jgi:hypothetical protein